MVIRKFRSSKNGVSARSKSFSSFCKKSVKMVHLKALNSHVTLPVVSGIRVVNRAFIFFLHSRQFM